MTKQNRQKWNAKKHKQTNKQLFGQSEIFHKHLPFCTYFISYVIVYNFKLLGTPSTCVLKLIISNINGTLEYTVCIPIHAVIAMSPSPIHNANSTLIIGSTI